MSALAGLRMALLESRMSDELAALVRRQGGDPYCVPAVREERADARAEVAALLDSYHWLGNVRKLETPWSARCWCATRT